MREVSIALAAAFCLVAGGCAERSDAGARSATTTTSGGQGGAGVTAPTKPVPTLPPPGGAGAGAGAGAGSGSGSGSAGSSTGGGGASSGGGSAGTGTSSGGAGAGSAGGSSTTGTSSGGGAGGSGTSGTSGTSGSGGGAASGGSSGGGGSSTGPTSGAGGGGSATGGGGSNGGGLASLTKIYINSSGGTVYEYDSANWSAERVIAPQTGAFSISSGPRANTIYLQMGTGFFSNGPLDALDLTTGNISSVGGTVYGNAVGEGRDGFLYSGSGYELYRVDPGSGASTHVGDGTWPYAGDLAVDPTTDILYGAVAGQWGVDLVIVNRTNGAQTRVGALGVTGDIWGLGFSGNGNLFAAGPDGNGYGAIYQVNKGTGAATVARSLNYEPFDMATQPYSVPEDEAHDRPDLAAGGNSGAGGGADGASADAGSVEARVYYAESFDGERIGLGWSEALRVFEVGAPVAGPRGAASGALCLSTRVVGGYAPFCYDTVETPPISLFRAERPVLSIRHWYDLEPGEDGARVVVRTARGEVAIAPEGGYPHAAVGALAGAAGFSGSTRGWAEATFDLSAFAGEEIRVALTFGSDAATSGEGWFVDDLRVSERPAASEPAEGCAN